MVFKLTMLDFNVRTFALEVTMLVFKVRKKDKNSTCTCGRLPATTMSRPFSVAPGQRISIDNKLQNFGGNCFGKKNALLTQLALKWVILVS